ncbi:hypothetical protein RIF29_20419 [Crotalaria pallida]|uniref:Uncharacterized protein n=1 Tax=Crotalaria pallida TaxID=3830 RepID=A0AAN9F3E5_CROPI
MSPHLLRKDQNTAKKTNSVLTYETTSAVSDFVARSRQRMHNLFGKDIDATIRCLSSDFDNSLNAGFIAEQSDFAKRQIYVRNNLEKPTFESHVPSSSVFQSDMFRESIHVKDNEKTAVPNQSTFEIGSRSRSHMNNISPFDIDDDSDQQDDDAINECELIEDDDDDFLDDDYEAILDNIDVDVVDLR